HVVRLQVHHAVVLQSYFCRATCSDWRRGAGRRGPTARAKPGAGPLCCCPQRLCGFYRNVWFSITYSFLSPHTSAGRMQNSRKDVGLTPLQWLVDVHEVPLAEELITKLRRLSSECRGTGEDTVDTFKSLEHA